MVDLTGLGLKALVVLGLCKSVVINGIRHSRKP